MDWLFRHPKSNAASTSSNSQNKALDDRKGELEQIIKRMKSYVQEAIHTVSE